MSPSRRETPAERQAYARWQERRRKLVSLGQWEPFVDAEPVREHLRKINAAGMSYRAICERLGLPQDSSLQYLMWGRGDGPGRQVRRETAELVLSYWPRLEDYPEGARVDATGTRRRVEALAVMGWSKQVLAERMAMRGEHLRKVVGRDRVTVRIARRVAAVYDALWNQDPLKHGVPLASVSRVLADAKRLGFSSPLAWDDDTIDDPAAEPDLGEQVPRFVELAENGFELEQRYGYTREHAAARLGVSKDVLQKSMGQYRAAQSEAGTPDACVTRERIMSQNQMGEAA
ncbi:hypothetical protein [Streptomyces sp. NPDC001274]